MHRTTACAKRIKLYYNELLTENYRFTTRV